MQNVVFKQKQMSQTPIKRLQIWPYFIFYKTFLCLVSALQVFSIPFDKLREKNEMNPLKVCYYKSSGKSEESDRK